MLVLDVRRNADIMFRSLGGGVGRHNCVGHKGRMSVQILAFFVSEVS